MGAARGERCGLDDLETAPSGTATKNPLSKCAAAKMPTAPTPIGHEESHGQKAFSYRRQLCLTGPLRLTEEKLILSHC
jgi:hypothetical protein